MKQLKQTKFIFNRQYSILDDGVKFISKNSDGYIEKTFKYDEIGFDEQIFDVKASVKDSFLAGSIMLNLLFIIATISSGGVKNAFESLFLLIIVFLVAIAIIMIIQKERNKFIVGATHIPFWYENRYKQNVDKFIEHIKIAKMQYMRNKYMPVSELEDEYSIKSKYNWLFEQKYITKDELQDCIEELEHRKIIKGK